MVKIRKNFRDEYIIIHHVQGEEAVLDFLRMTSHTILDRLCFQAKNHAFAEFRFRDTTYRMTFERGDVFVIEPIKDNLIETM